MTRQISQFFRIGRWLLLIVCISLLVMNFTGTDVKAFVYSAPRTVTFSGAADSPISSAVAVPAGQAYYWTSGTVPPVTNPDAPPRTRDRYGDTETQAIGIFQRFETLLQEAGLSLNDVIYLRAYLVADPANNNEVDYQGWFDAYAQFFNNETNPTKVARSTVAVAGLVDPGWLIEVEAVAVYPERK